MNIFFCKGSMKPSNDNSTQQKSLSRRVLSSDVGAKPLTVEQKLFIEKAFSGSNGS
nr:hypothetical protein [uncultured Ruminococcus sp.]